MKNRKGFTLIEILGVVIVIAIIVIVAIPSVTSYISSSKKKTYTETVNGYIRAVKAKVGSFKYRFDNEDNIYYVPISCIPVDKEGKSPYGDIQEAYVVVVNNNGNYKYYWTSYDNTGYGIELTAEKDLKDLKIETDMYSIDKEKVVEGKTSYVDMDSNTCNKRPKIGEIELGYQIYPNKEIYTTGGLTESSGTITTNTTDPYLDFSGLKEYSSVTGAVIYFANATGENIPITLYTRDKDTYNMAKGIKGVVKSGEKEARIVIPEGTYNGIRVDIGERSGLTYKIDRIELIVADYVGLYTNKDITAYVGGIKEEEGIDEYSYDNGQTWVKTSSKRYSSNVKANILIKDLIGSKSETKELEIKMIDKINPTCTLGASGTLGDNGWYRSNVKVLFATKKDAGNSQYSASGIRRVGFGNIAGSETEVLDIDTAGQAYVGYIEDRAGNTATCTATFKRDTGYPTCTNSGDSTVWATSRTINYGCSDTLSGCNTTYSGGNKNFTTTTRTSVISGYTIKDNAGNSTNCPSRTATVNVDKTPPACITSGGSSNWVKGSLTITGSCSDAESGCASPTISKNYSSTINSMETPGVISDKLGNTKTCPTTKVMIDNTAPTCTWTGGGWATSITVTATGSDAHSGISGNTSQSQTVSSAGDVSKIFSDMVGNTTTCSINVDERTEYRKRECDTCKRCSSASCEKWEACSACGCTCSGWTAMYANCIGDSTCKNTTVNSCTESKTVCSTRDSCADAPGMNGSTKYATSYKRNCSYKRCSSCDCQTRERSCSKCGCEDWKSWEGWTTTKYTDDSNTDVQTRTTYFAE